MRKITCSAFAILAVCMILQQGCTKNKGPKVYHVTGKVTWNGEPLADASIVFSPIGSEGLAASGKTNAEGVYLIQTPTGLANGGTTPGKYKVSFKKVKTEWDGKSYLPNPGGEPIPNSRAIEVLPKQYRDQKTTPCEAEVVAGKEGTNVFDFNIEGK